MTGVKAVAVDGDLMRRIEEGNRFLMEGRSGEARTVYVEVWHTACASGDDYSACAAAHMLGAMEAMPPEERLEWHLASLDRARLVRDGRLDAWYASIYLNIGHSYRLLGRPAEAIAYYEEGLRTDEIDGSPYSQAVRATIAKAIAELRNTAQDEEASTGPRAPGPDGGHVCA